MSKLTRGTLPFSAPVDSPFPAWPFDAQGNPRQTPRAEPTLLVQYTWALGIVSTAVTPIAGVVANLRRQIGDALAPAQRSVTVAMLWINQVAQFPLLALESLVDNPPTPGTIGIAVFQGVNWFLQFFPVVYNTYIFTRLEPLPHFGAWLRYVPMTDSEAKLLTVYGIFHAVLYTTQAIFAQAVQVPGSSSAQFATATAENWLRWLGNLAQTVPEIDTWMRKDPKIMVLNYVMVGVQTATAAARLGMLWHDQVAFAAH